MKKITPFVWFEKNLKEITDFYLSVFPESSLKSGGELLDTPSGNVEMATLNLYGQNFDLMTAGPQYVFKPSVSFMISCDSIEEVEILWNQLIVEGQALMSIDTYPFAEKYGWLQDRYGISWQIMKGAQKTTQKIIPTLMFSGKNNGRAGEAIDFYLGIFKNSTKDFVMNYEEGESFVEEAKIKYSQISLDDYKISLMDSGSKNDFDFEQGVSFMVNCQNQEEIDYFWENLTKDGGQEIQCGWLKDKFGFPWQIVPVEMGEMMTKGSKEQIDRVTKAFLQMKKFDIKKLEDAYNG